MQCLSKQTSYPVVDVKFFVVIVVIVTVPLQNRLNLVGIKSCTITNNLQQQVTSYFNRRKRVKKITFLSCRVFSYESVKTGSSQIYKLDGFSVEYLC